MALAWSISEADWPGDPAGAAGTLAADSELAWLDTAAAGAAPTGESLLCAAPLAVLEQYEGGPARLRIGARTVAEDADGWRLWRQAAGRLPRLGAAPCGLAPGWVGYVGFEMARFLERLPASHHEDLGLPLLRLALFDRGIVLDHARQRALALRAPGLAAAVGADADEPAAAWLGRWGRAAAGGRPLVPPAPLAVRCEAPRAAHEAAVRRALEYIAAGDIYQVNLAQRLWLDGAGEPLALYAAARRRNPAPYGALLRWPDGAVASLSPELFLELRGDAVRTRPIKGTARRTGERDRDEAARRGLIASAKEAAELAMIVDLHRNDLGRVCRYGSVRVVHPRRVEAHPSVLHTVAEVAGRLAPGRDALDLLRACFPAGSVTGVPKIRALEIIDELEPMARGAYTGAIGVLGLDGQATFNVAIRTLQIRGRAATLCVGGGIVADSDPAAEYEETLDKARGILRGLGAEAPERAALVE